MRLLIVIIVGIALVGCGNNDTIEEKDTKFEGEWELVQVKNLSTSEVTIHGEAEKSYLSISSDRFYKLYVSELPFESAENSVLLDTNIEGYDYKLNDMQVVLIKAEYAPPNVVIPDGLNIIKKNSSFIKYEIGRNQLKIKSLDEASMTFSYSNFPDKEFVYRKLSGGKNTLTQQELESKIL